ncbi:adenylate/guanylate cyclase domain-containing protein [Patescibacteria group bacterium]|nr:adenylate/guanylate cyclase domain-containing protein [Patescibacteria group bacterium]
MTFFRRPVFFAAVLIALLVTCGATLGIFQSWQWKMSDALFVTTPAPDDVVIVGIDNASIQALGAWPWQRGIHAQLIEALAGAGARVIGYDINFSEAKTEQEDAALEQALARAKMVILPYEARLDLSTYPPHAAQPLVPLARFSKNATLGISNTPPDIADGVLRRIPREVIAPDGTRLPAFFAAMLLRGGNPPVQASGPLVVQYVGPAKTIRTVSVQDVLSGRLSADTFRGKYVLVGATAPDLQDFLLTPTAKSERMSGVEVHANALVSARTGGLREEPLAAVAGTIFLFALIAVFATELRRIRHGVLLLVGLFVAYLLLGFILFEYRILLSFFYPLVALVWAAITAVLFRLAREKKEKGQIRTTLQRYVSPQVVEHLLQHPELLELGGEKREMTVLFSDLRGFTSLSEILHPEQLVAVLNTYLSEMTAIVFEQRGVLDKYMGDAVMAFWNAPLDDAAHAEHAVTAALAMRDRLHEMNATGAFPGGVALRLGVGVNTGPMVVGNIGGKERFDYTVMGDAVNLGSRLEGTNKEYGTEVIVSASTAALLSDGFVLRPLDLVAVKGKKEPVEIFEAVGMRATVAPERIELVEQFKAARRLYATQHFAEARAALAKIAERWPDDGPTNMYLARCDVFLAAPPSAEWNGVWVMTRK